MVFETVLAIPTGTLTNYCIYIYIYSVIQMKCLYAAVWARTATLSHSGLVPPLLPRYDLLYSAGPIKCWF